MSGNVYSIKFMSTINKPCLPSWDKSERKIPKFESSIKPFLMGYLSEHTTK